ncbi:RNase H domain-containing protein [Caerostris extrusa]|uniref:RNase H domain-containing protein n=1 Tax=Caerostris extrusa TaxID=172846 RepID=A0AAV4Q859_CAEEX|nr:RNase H domain-containing protein [Caerostris extrusa]
MLTTLSPLMVNDELQLLDKDENTLKNSLQNYNCSPETPLTLPIVPRHDPPLCEIFLQNHGCLKSHVSTSIAGISCNQSFSYRINPINSVFTAEVLAICVAIDELAIVDKDILILSDSFSALNSLKNLNIHSTYAIQRLASKLFVRQTFNQNITFLWFLVIQKFYGMKKQILSQRIPRNSRNLLNEWMS